MEYCPLTAKLERLLLTMCCGLGCCIAAEYSAVDQGAFNQFYEHEIKGKPLSRVSSLAHWVWAGPTACRAVTGAW